MIWFNKEQEVSHIFIWNMIWNLLDTVDNNYVSNSLEKSAQLFLEMSYFIFYYWNEMKNFSSRFRR